MVGGNVMSVYAYLDLAFVCTENWGFDEFEDVD